MSANDMDEWVALLRLAENGAAPHPDRVQWMQAELDLLSVLEEVMKRRLPRNKALRAKMLEYRL